MDREMTKRELILGCILCLCLTFTVFLPRVVFHPYDLAEKLSDTLADDMALVLNQYLEGVEEFIGIEGKFEDEDVAEFSDIICTKLREGFFGSKSCEITSADILRLDRAALREVIDEAFSEFDKEYKIQLSDIVDSENLSSVLYESVKQELRLLKITLGVLYGAPLLLAGVYAMAYYGRKRRRVAACFTVGYILAGLIAQLFWCLGLPGMVTDVFHKQSESFVENLAESLREAAEQKFSKNSILEGFLGGAADRLIQDSFVEPMLAMCRHMEDILNDALKGSVGSGVWLYFVLLLLLFGWVLWGLLASTLIDLNKRKEGIYMAKFCRYCGRQLREGEVCNCTRQNQGNARPAGQQPQNAPGGQRGGAAYHGNGNGRVPNGPGAQGGGYVPNGNGSGRMPNSPGAQGGGYPPNGNGSGRMPNSPSAQRGGYAPNGSAGGRMPNGSGARRAYPPNGGGNMPNSPGAQGGGYPPNGNYPPNGYGGNNIQNGYGNPAGDYGQNSYMENAGGQSGNKDNGGMIGLAIASMVLGIVSLVFSCCFPYVTFFTAVVGAALGGVALAWRKAGKGMAIAGLVCSIISLVPAVIILITTGGAMLAALGM